MLGLIRSLTHAGGTPLMTSGSDAPVSRIEAETPELVDCLRLGGADAGRLLNELYREALVRFCWGYLGRIEEAEDAVQDICCKVIASTVYPESFRAWIYQLARNHCLNLLRDKARRPEGGELPQSSQVVEAMTGHLTRMARHEQWHQLDELVRSLPDAQREVLRLRYVEDLSRTEIAEVLEISESLVKSRLFQAMKALKEVVADLDGSD